MPIMLGQNWKVAGNARLEQSKRCEQKRQSRKAEDPGRDNLVEIPECND
jgi:hypothetical protein